jgi:hypothetical protein
MKIYRFSYFLILCGLLHFTPFARATLPPMSDDIHDALFHWEWFHPVDLNAGGIEKIIDHRGYLPIAAASQEETKTKYVQDSAGKITSFHWGNATDDDYRYFKCRLDWGLVLCLEKLSTNHEAEELVAKAKELTNSVKIFKESQVEEHDLKWVSIAQSVNRSGKALFDALPGKPFTARFDESDVIATVFYEESVLIILNIRYSTWARNGSGQLLLGFEFSRRVPEYRKLYPIKLLGGVDVGGSSPIVSEALKPILVDLLGQVFK